jgi:hypothetical protein
LAQRLYAFIESRLAAANVSYNRLCVGHCYIGRRDEAEGHGFRDCPDIVEVLAHAIRNGFFVPMEFKEHPVARAALAAADRRRGV